MILVDALTLHIFVKCYVLDVNKPHRHSSSTRTNVNLSNIVGTDSFDIFVFLYGIFFAKEFESILSGNPPPPPFYLKCFISHLFTNFRRFHSFLHKWDTHYVTSLDNVDRVKKWCLPERLF